LGIPHVVIRKYAGEWWGWQKLVSAILLMKNIELDPADNRIED